MLCLSISVWSGAEILGGDEQNLENTLLNESISVPAASRGIWLPTLSCTRSLVRFASTAGRDVSGG
jgi:hypothetical protein